MWCTCITVNRIATLRCIACCVHGVFVHSHGVTAGLHTGIVWGLYVCIEREVELTEGLVNSDLCTHRRDLSY